MAHFSLDKYTQFQHLFFRLLLRPVVKTHADGPGDRLERTAVLVIIARRDVLLIQPSGVKEEAHRHIRVKLALMFPQVHLKVDNEGDIVLHAHVYRITDGVEADPVRISVLPLSNHLNRGFGVLFHDFLRNR